MGKRWWYPWDGTLYCPPYTWVIIYWVYLFLKGSFGVQTARVPSQGAPTVFPMKIWIPLLFTIHAYSRYVVTPLWRSQVSNKKWPQNRQKRWSFSVAPGSVSLQINGCFLKWWYTTTIGFPAKNDHFGVFWGYHHLRKHPNLHKQKSAAFDEIFSSLLKINRLIYPKHSMNVCPHLPQQSTKCK